MRPEHFREFVFAARTLWKDRAFSAVAVLTLALGIGATTAIFSVVNGVLLQPLPYEAAGRQVQLMVAQEARTGPPSVRPVTLTAAETMELARRTRVFDQVGNIGFSLSNWRGHEPRWSGAVVSASVFSMLGVRPLIGRSFVPGDERPGAPGAIVLSFGSWQRHFAGDAGALGQTIALESALGPPGPPETYTVVGVMPAGFEYKPGSESAYWLPLQQSGRGSVVARLAEGVSVASAAAEIEPILKDLQGRRPGPRALAYSIEGLQEQLVAPVRPALLMLMGAVGVVLLIACVNVANLLLVRSVSRRREMAIRTALGASRGRIVRLLMTESLLLTAIAAACGIALAAGGVRLLRWLATTAERIDLGQAGGTMIPRLSTVSLDGSVLGFTLVVAVAAAVLFGVAPALQQTRLPAAVALRNGPGGTSSDGAGFHTLGIRGVLIIAEVALSIVLLIGGGLLISSFIRLVRVDVGYDPTRVLTFQVSLPSERYTLPKLGVFAEDLVSRLASVHDVEGVAYANQLPLVRLQDRLVLGRTPDPQRQPGGGVDVRVVSRTYFTTMRIPLVSGRLLDERDAAGQPRALVINEELARREFGDSASAVGRQLYLWRETTPWNIVGVVSDVRQVRLDKAAEPQFFVDARQWADGPTPLFPLGPYYTVRFAGEESDVIAAVQAAVRQADAEGILFNVAPMRDIMSSAVARPRMFTVLLGVFAVIGLTIALVGIYGVMSYTVFLRTRELGIRMALGARPGNVLALVLRQSLLLTGTGIALGLLAAVALTPLLETMLFGITPLDLPTFAGVGFAFAAIATLAAYVPARRATMVDPLLALRAD